MEALGQRLRAGLNSLGLNTTDNQQTQLLSYLNLIQKWTRVYNLTALRNPTEMLTHHLFDALTVVLPLCRVLESLPPPHDRVLDVGSGAGLPGVVIAICCPDLSVACLDAVGKKAAFIQQASISLGLKNLRSIHGRIEAERGQYDVLCSRAFASLKDFTGLSRLATREGGVWMAMKGKVPNQEIDALPADLSAFHVEQLQVPGLEESRCLVWIAKAAAPNLGG